MSKSETMTTNTGKAGEPAALTDKDLEAASGGMDLKGASEAMTQRAQQNVNGHVKVFDGATGA